MTKTGIVLQINKNIIYLMTPGGEFVKVKATGTIPSIGESYTGQLYIQKRSIHLPAAAAAIFMFIFTSAGLYSYYTPVAAITIEINPAMRLQLNMWNRIIKAEPLNEDGQKVLSNLNLTFKSADKGLEAIVEQAKKDKYIDEKYIVNKNEISIRIEEKKEDQIDISNFEENVKKQNIKVKVVEDVKGNKDDKDNKNNKDNKDKSKEPGKKNDLKETPAQNNKNKQSSENPSSQAGNKNKQNERRGPFNWIPSKANGAPPAGVKR
jgi:hypothetical protein